MFLVTHQNPGSHSRISVPLYCFKSIGSFFFLCHRRKYWISFWVPWVCHWHKLYLLSVGYKTDWKQHGHLVSDSSIIISIRLLMPWHFLYGTHRNYFVLSNLLLTRHFIFIPLQFPSDKKEWVWTHYMTREKDLI